MRLIPSYYGFKAEQEALARQAEAVERENAEQPRQSEIAALVVEREAVSGCVALRRSGDRKLRTAEHEALRERARELEHELAASGHPAVAPPAAWPGHKAARCESREQAAGARAQRLPIAPFGELEARVSEASEPGRRAESLD